MKRLKRKTRRTLVLTGYALGAALAVLMLPARLTTPLRVVLTEVTGPVEGVAFQAGGDVLASSGTLRDAFLAHERLRVRDVERGRLRSENARLREIIASQHRLLRSVKRLEFRSSQPRRVGASVTAYDAGATRHSIVIAAGSADGVEAGQAVCSLGWVVGVVAEVGVWRSRVGLVTDPAARLPCRVRETRERVLLEGDGSAVCKVRWVDRESEAARDNVLVTGPVDDVLGERSVIPAGLPVATIGQVARGGENALFLQVFAKPGVDVRRLEYVEVIVPREEDGGGD